MSRRLNRTETLSWKEFFPFVANSRMIFIHVTLCTGRDNVVSIMTCYGLDSPGIESQWGERFSTPVQTTLRPVQPPIPCVLGLFFQA